MKINTYKQVNLFKEKQFFKFFVKRNTQQQCKLCTRAKLVIFDGADGLP